MPREGISSTEYIHINQTSAHWVPLDFQRFAKWWLILLPLVFLAPILEYHLLAGEGHTKTKEVFEMGPSENGVLILWLVTLRWEQAQAQPETNQPFTLLRFLPVWTAAKGERAPWLHKGALTIIIHHHMKY